MTRSHRYAHPGNIAGYRSPAIGIVGLLAVAACTTPQASSSASGSEDNGSGATASTATTTTATTIAAAPGVAPRGPFRAADLSYRVVTVATGLEHPWGIAFLPDGGLLVTERSGQLRLVRDGQVVSEPVGGVPAVRASGQGGLLDVALHPDYAQNRLVYLSYSKPGDQGATTAVARGTFDGTRLNDVRDIFVANAWASGGSHFGSRLVFDDGYLFISIGDRGAMQQAQNLSNHQGTIIRLHDDGRVPADNPFAGQAGALPEIWAYGVRNPQGMKRHPQTGELWEVEHGPRGGDEVNLIRPGLNYGWPAITYGINYNGQIISEHTEMEGMEQPLHYWVPSIATSGMTIYDGDAFPAWRGNVFVGGLAGQQIARLVFRGEQFVSEETLLAGQGRVRDLRTGPDGFIYAAIDDSDGAVLRLEPAD